jgi:release factor glutamine methyltransferase
MHGVGERLEIIRSNVFESVPREKFDLIVSNPPYVPLAEYTELQPEVRDHDPHIALTDGSTGLTIIERIVADAPGFLTSGKHLLVEIGHGQSGPVEALVDPSQWRSAEFIHDLQGIPRTLDAKLL